MRRIAWRGAKYSGNGLPEPLQEGQVKRRQERRKVGVSLDAGEKSPEEGL